MKSLPYSGLRILLWCILLISPVSCGIDNYPYLPPVPAGNVSYLSGNSGAVINLPAIDAAYANYFRNFTFYYRIYISDINMSVSVSDLSRINNVLNSDYIALQQYTDSDETKITTIIGNTFTSRNYYTLALEGNSIENILSGTGASRVVLDFADIPNTVPRLTLNNQDYQLYRYSETAIMRPVPSDRYFINSSSLTNEANISTVDKTNLDIQKTSPPTSGPRYAYVSIYVLATGIDDNFSPIYSKPAFVGIFRIPGGPS